MKKTITAFLLFAFVLTSGPEAWAISWETDLDGAFKKAKAEGKPVMADFYTEWCGWCKKLDEDVYVDETVDKLAERFICVKVDCGVDKNAFSKYKLRGYPTVIFFSAAGKTVDTVVGYRNAPTFAGIMKAVLDKSPKAKTAAAAQPKPASEFELAGIMGSKAIINGKTVAVGDEVDSAKVVAITSTSVKLQYKNKELRLEM
ncbi:MAG: thioredoxin family protein [Candidatus Omnitrophica bacterium]|nr:thioredoxin family protein [Candidatus Omnitrophota bacterium]